MPPQPEILAAHTELQQQAWAQVNLALGNLAVAYGLDPDLVNEDAGSALEVIVTELYEAPSEPQPQLAVVPPLPEPAQPSCPPCWLAEQDWNTSKLRYAEKVAIRMAIDVVGVGPHWSHHDRYVGSTDQLCRAARNLGAVGATRVELLQDLGGIMSLYGVEVTGTVKRALAEVEPDV